MLTRMFVILAVVLLAGCVGTVGLYAWLFPSGTYCPPFYASCPAGADPVGAAVLIQNATGSCGSSGAGSPSVCTYAFNLLVDHNGTSVPAAADLFFKLADTDGNTIAGGFSSITLVRTGGCSVGSWSATAGAWSATLNPLPCHNVSIADPIVGGEELVLFPVPASSLSLSGRGYHLIAVAQGPDFTGTTNGYWGAIP